MADDDKPTVKQRLYEVPVVGIVLRMQDRYVADDADQHAAAIGFYGFLSLFPLLLLALSVAGFVLRGDPGAQADFTDAVLRAVPGFADTFAGDEGSVRDAVEALTDNAGSVGLAGLLSLLLTGLKVVSSASTATLHAFHVRATSSGLVRKARLVGVLVVLGLLAVAGVAATGLVGAAATLATDEVAGLGGGDVDRLLQVVATTAGLAGSVAADFLLFVGSYKLLSWGRGPRFREVWPGALVAAVGWTLLKAFGATYVSNQIAKTNELVGAFGGVVGLLLLLYLAGRVYLYGAEFTALVRDPGYDLARREDDVEYQGEDVAVVGPTIAARKQAARARDVGDPPTAPVPSRAAAGVTSPRPRPDERSPAVSARTQGRLHELDEARRARRDVGMGGPTGLGGTPGEHRGGVHEGRNERGGADVRGAAAVVLAVGAVGALVAAAKPWKDRP